MALDSTTFPWADRHATGTLHYRNIYANTFGYTETRKKVAAGTTTAVLTATPGSNSSQTITTGIVNPDVPRALSVTAGGTTAQVQTSSVIVTGLNVEGKTITESFAFAQAVGGTVNGLKAFKSVSSVFVPAQLGAGVTYAVGTQNVLGLNHRLFKNQTTVKVYTTTAAYGALTLQGVPVVVAHDNFVENNTVLPLTIPNGNLIFTICYAFDNWALSPFQDQPEYSTTTSTSSTSSSTSTTTITTSTSSTSSSTSSTSTSSTSTSISTSSTSTSTTTTP